MKHLSRFAFVVLLIASSAVGAQTTGVQPTRLPPNMSISGYPGSTAAGPTAQPVTRPTGIYCTHDAKICPDGTAVGRTGPRCEFAPCPQAGVSGFSPGSSGGGAPPDDQAYYEPPPPAPDVYKPTAPPRLIGPPEVMCTQEVKMCPDGSGVGRTGPNCDFAPCPGEKRR